MYICLAAGVEIERFGTYKEAYEYMCQMFGQNFEMYDYGIVEEYE